MRWRAPHPAPGARPSTPRLHYLELDSGRSSRWLYVLHGIYGAGRNWGSIARALVSARPEWGVVLVDLRLHGRSQGFEPPHTLHACAHDLFELIENLGKPADAILGHSFGGKVAVMSAGLLAPDQVWVVDSTLSRRSPGGGAYRMLQILKRLPGPFESRTEVVDLLVERQVIPFVAHWMATNLELKDGRFRWRLDLDGLEALLDDFFRTDLWDVLERPWGETQLHFVKATESDVMPEAECARLENGSLGGDISVHRVHGGHWIHVDNPVDLLTVLSRGLA